MKKDVFEKVKLDNFDKIDVFDLLLGDKLKPYVAAPRVRAELTEEIRQTILSEIRSALKDRIAAIVAEVKPERVLETRIIEKEGIKTETVVVREIDQKALEKALSERLAAYSKQTEERWKNIAPIVVPNGIPNQEGHNGQVLSTDGRQAQWVVNTASGAGTVTTLSVVTNQGVSGSVANPTTTPAITLSLGALTGATSYNGLVVTANTGTITTGVWNGTAVGVANGGTGVATFASNGVLYGNGATSVLVTAQGIANSILTANAGAPIFSDAPIIGTSITCPTHYGSSSSGGNLVLQSTSNATRGFVQVEDLCQVGTSAHAFAATASYYIDVGTGGSSVTTGAMTALRWGNTLTIKGASASATMALFNAQGTVTDDGTSRTILSNLMLSSNLTYTATVASGLIVNDLAGIPAHVGLYHAITANRSGAGTGTLQTSAAVHLSNNSNIGVGWTVTNLVGLLLDVPTVGGTLTNYYGVKGNGAAATNRWFLYETGGMQSSHKGKVRFGDNTAPGALVELAPGTATANTSPLKFTSGTNLTAAEAGATEYDGVQFYETVDTSSGRGAIPVEQYFHLTANGSAITTIANFFGATSNINIVASAYYIIDIYFWYVTTGTGAVTFTFTNSAAPTSQNIYWEMSPVGGVVAPPGTATMLVGQTLNDATAARTVVTGSLTAATHYAHIKIWLKNGTGTTFKIQATAGGTNLTPQIGSWWIARRMSPNNIGTFAA